MAYSGNLQVIPFASYRVFQRDCRSGDPIGSWSIKYGKGWSTINLTLSPTAAPRRLDYRVRDASSPSATPVLNWTSCSGPLPTARTTIPILLPAKLGWFLVDVRADADDGSIETTNPIGVGEVIAASGQSLASDLWSTVATSDPGTLGALGVVPSPYGVCYASWDGMTPPSVSAAWTAPDDSSAYKSSFCGEFLRLAVDGTGVNCALVGYAWSGEPIAAWRSDGSGPKDVWSPLITTLDNAVDTGGKIGTFVWVHGHNDARIPQAGVDGDELSTDKYLSALSTMMSALASRYSGYPFRRILSSIPAIGANWVNTSPKFVPSYIQEIRAAHLRFVASDSLAIGHIDGLDITLWSDDTHPSQAGNISFARHFYRAFMAGINPEAYVSGDTGPRLTGAASRYIGDNRIYLNVAHSGGTELVCSGGNSGATSQFQVFKSASTASADKIPLASVDLSIPNTIALVLASTPPDNQPLDVWYRLPPDNNAALLPVNQIYDDNTTGRAADNLTMGRQLSMRPVPISVPAPTGSKPLLLAPNLLLSVAPSTSALTTR